ncbi:hypothetical protein ACFQMA_21815 [Halosimplex aquaticum]|uniref:DUF7322 domain-containing protein n=1 Tax=Halosimplex aquaticum TaxID=3026162 RepID=A0ABD5Y5F5_9EURY|nr:hypothetical protein [Halosimplex aquaticum]
MSNDADEDDGLLGGAERFESSLGPDVPEVDVPEVDIPSVPGAADAGETDEADAGALDGDVDPEVSRTFWRLVLVFDVALLAMSLGPMFVFFRSDWDTGGPLFVLGVAAFVYGVREYRQFRDGRE